MEPKIFKIGQEVTLPDGTRGVIVEESEIGELRIEAATRTWWLYQEDLETIQGGE